MSEPLVVGVCLTADRADMTARAIRSFEAQIYQRKCLLVLDSGKEGPDLRTSIRLIYKRLTSKYPVGELRNIANAMAGGADIIAHFDSDDWSHPRRLEEQVALLQATGADCVGYSQILFWDSRKSEAWIYENDALDISTKFNPGYEDSYPPVGASYCYWRAAWERLKFPEIAKGEDTDWKRKGARCYGESGVSPRTLISNGEKLLDVTPMSFDQTPRLVCEIHGANTSSSIQQGFDEFRRAPQWDGYCREKMEVVKCTS